MQKQHHVSERPQQHRFTEPEYASGPEDSDDQYYQRHDFPVGISKPAVHRLPVYDEPRLEQHGHIEDELDRQEKPVDRKKLAHKYREEQIAKDLREIAKLRKEDRELQESSPRQSR